MTQKSRSYVELQEEVIKISVKLLGELDRLPLCVELIASLPPPDKPSWVPESGEFVYLHIRSPYSPIRTPNTSLCYDTWDHFLERTKGFLKEDINKILSIQQTSQ